MNQKEYDQNAPGKLLRQQGYWTYLPNPLPPKLEWTDPLISKLSKAERGLAQLNQVGQSIPALPQVTRSLMRREAVLSSRIEGTRTTLRELFAYEFRQAPLSERADAQEVQNYVKAFEYGFGRLAELPVSLRLIRELHAELMHGIHGEVATPGEFRRKQNWISGETAKIEDARYVPPSVVAMKSCLNQLETFVHASSDLPPLVRLAMIHYQFEAIHPFLDGNGRVGRLLLSLLLHHWGLIEQPIIGLSAYFERHQPQYYGHLLAVSRKGDWMDWLNFFLDGVVQQTKEAISCLERIKEVREQYLERIKNEPDRLTLIHAFDFLIGQPIVSVNLLQDALGLDDVSTRAVVDRLVAHAILRESGEIFVADGLLSVIEGK